jgi:soluble lytic murein transglycosylase-like protein
MANRFIRLQLWRVAAVLACALPACAQIAAHRSGRGVIVYTNAEAPNPPLPTPGGRFAQISHPTERRTLEPLVRRQAQQHHLDPRLVEAVIRVESDWNSSAISSKGAEGIMQLIPATSRRVGVQDALNSSQNIRGGVAYLSDLVSRFGGDLRESLAAYYAGQGAVERAGGVPSSPAIAGYVRHVLNVYFQAGSFRQPVGTGPNAIYATLDGQGRLVFTNQ